MEALAKEEYTNGEYLVANSFISEVLKRDPNNQEALLIKDEYSQKAEEETLRRSEQAKIEEQKAKEEAEKEAEEAEIQRKAEAKTKGVKIGMTQEQVLESSWGEPEDINRTTYTFGVHEQWCYQGYNYLYFEDGVLTTIQN